MQATVDFKFWLLAYFLNTLIYPKLKGGPYEMTDINFVQSCSNFPQFSKIRKHQVAKI